MTIADPILSARGLRRTYRMGRVDVPVLKGVDFEVARGGFVAVLGASGSGKSTLLHLLGGLDRPDRPHEPRAGVFYEGRNLADFSEGERNAYRRRSVGFVFQFYHLLPELNVLENVLLGAMIRYGRFGYLKRRAEERAGASEMLAALGLGERLRHRPGALSGGERQRVAIARALVNRPPILLADEPTGNLDRATGGRLMLALEELRDRLGLTIIMVTHDPAIAGRADRTVRLEDGALVESVAVAGCAEGSGRG